MDANELTFKLIDLNTCTPEMASATPPPSIKDDPGSVCFFRHTEDTQDLLVTVNVVAMSVQNRPDYPSDHVYQINLQTISTGEEHPLAHGPFLVASMSDSDSEFDGDSESRDVNIAVLGDHLAFHEVVTPDSVNYSYWSLHVWNWHEDSQRDVGVSFRLSFKGLIRALTRAHVCSVKA